MGANWRMSEPHAAIVLSQLRRLDEHIERRARRSPRGTTPRVGVARHLRTLRDPAPPPAATTTSTSRSFPTASTARSSSSTLRDRVRHRALGRGLRHAAAPSADVLAARRPTAAGRRVAVRAPRVPAPLPGALRGRRRLRRRVARGGARARASCTRCAPDASPRAKRGLDDTATPIAVTGGSGFIGSHVVDALLGAGLRRCASSTSGRRGNPNAEWAEVDLLEQDALTDALKGCGPVFHLAAMADVNEVIADPAESVAVTVLGAARVLEAARRADAGRVILASTVWVYAATHGDVVDEDTQFDLTAERHIYASSKLAAEMFCADYANLFGRPYTVLALRHPVRAAHAQRPRGRRVPRTGVARRAAAHRRRRRAGAVVRVRRGSRRRARARAGAGRGEPHVQPRGERADLDPRARRDGRRARGRRRGDVRAVAARRLPGPERVSSERARASSGWTPRYDFAAGLQRTLEWYRSDDHAGDGPERRRRGLRRAPARGASPSSPRTTKSRPSSPCSTSSTRTSTSSWSSTTARPTAPAPRSSAGSRSRPCRLLWHDVNQGMSEAYILALTLAARRGSTPASSRRTTSCSPSTPTASTISRCSTSSSNMTIDEGLDAMLARRDLSYHGPYKSFGNAVFSGWASCGPATVSTTSSRDIASSGSGSLAHALDFYTGYKYSETVEVAVVMSRLGYRVRNDHLVPVPVSRSRTRLRDAVIDLAVIPVAAARVWRREPAPRRPRLRPRPRRAHRRRLGRRGVARDRARPRDEWREHGRRGDAAARSRPRWSCGAWCPPPSLALLGPCSPRVAAWLVPQRTDLGSAAALARGVRGRRGARRPRDPPPASLRAHDRHRAPRRARRLMHARDALLVIGVLGVVAAAAISVAGAPRPERRPRRAPDARVRHHARARHLPDDGLLRREHGVGAMVRRRGDPRTARQRQGRDHVRRRPQHQRDPAAHAHPRRRARARAPSSSSARDSSRSRRSSARSTRTATSSRITRITTTDGVGSTRGIPSSSARRSRSSGRSARARRGSGRRTAIAPRSWPASCGSTACGWRCGTSPTATAATRPRTTSCAACCATRAAARSSTCATASTVHRPPTRRCSCARSRDPRRSAGQAPRAGAARRARRRSRLHVV